MKKRRVAIVGMSYRLPGADREQFWQQLLAGKHLVTQIGPERWSPDTFLHPKRSHPGTSVTFAAGTIGDVSGFDAAFFGISPREAAQMDPQQRLLLELSWEAMEHAGIRPSTVRGSTTGVFIGVSSIDYSLRFTDDLAAVDSSFGTGNTASIAANRISYVFDLRGPSLSVDTACSSALFAFHLACRSILSGDCTQALCGGVNLLLHPYIFVAFSKASMLSRRGVCNVFDASGDGYVRSEGGAIFVLKDYDQAVADGDRILAIVANSAVNSDGRSKSGLTVPSARAQALLLKQVYEEAGIDPAEVDYIEAHGTGTAVGDPIETHALGEALGRARPAGSPLLIGSVKSNVGHLEAAAGAAGLVKALLCIRHRTVPATIHLEQPNPNIRFDEWNLKVATEPTPLKPNGKLVIGVNSFGFGGANAHVILTSPESRPRRRVRHAPGAVLPVAVSAKTAGALRSAARALAEYLETERRPSLYDVAWTSLFHREQHEHRALFFANSVKSLAGALGQFADGAAPALCESGTTVASPAEAAFVYSGNGAQWEGMGRRLLAEEPAFRETVRRIDEIFRPLAGYSLEEELSGANGSGRYAFTEIAQPALFAIQVAVTELLRSRGLAPAAVVGHSVGEVAAAWASGALTLEQAVRVIYHRSRLQSTTKGRGQMTAVALGEKAARELIDQLGLARGLAIAGVNSATSVTVAGETAALDVLEAGMNQRRVSYKRLDLDYAFHSPAMDGIEAGIREALADLKPGDTRVAFHSAVTGGALEGARLDAEYWWRNIREPVRFQDAVHSLIGQGVRVFVEVGPHALLRGYLSACLREQDVQGRVVATLLREDDGPNRLWSALGQAAVAGAPVDWRALLPQRGRLAELPHYPWQRETHWLSPTPGSPQRLQRRKEHPLLGYRLQEGEWVWENVVDTALYPHLAHHVVGDAVLMPGAGFAEMALAAARLWLGEALVEIEQLEIRSPLVLSEAQSKLVRFAIDPSDGSFTIRSRDQLSNEAWTVHATGRLLREPKGIALQQPQATLPSRPADLDGHGHYQITSSLGLEYGPSFRPIDAVWLEPGAVLARLRVPEIVEPEIAHSHLHPALLDGAFQLVVELLKDEMPEPSGMIFVPAKIDSLVFRAGSGAPQMARAVLQRAGPHSLVAEFTLFDAAGAVVASVRGMRFRSVRVRKNPADRLRFLDYHGIPKPHPLSPVTAPRRLFDQLQKRFTDLAHAASRQETHKRYTSEIEPLLDGLCARFALRSLKSLSANRQILTEADLHACLEAHPSTGPLLARLIGMLEEDHAIEHAGEGWRFLPEDDGLPAPEDIWNTLVTDHPDYFPIFHAVGRVGMHLTDLLWGRKTPEAVYPRECTLTSLTRRVLLAAGLPAMQQAVHALVEQTLKHLPAGKRLRIVEIGAESPVFAPQVCKGVDFNRCDYVFTTLAPSVPEACHRLRERFPGLEVRQIEAGSDFAESAVASEQFQLALIAGDFATERDALFALGHARRHLAPGAALLLIEQHASRWMDFIFGAQREWWSEGPGDAWLSRHRPSSFWRQHLQQLGLHAAHTLELSSDGSSGPYVVLAQATEQAVSATPPQQQAPRTWLMLEDKEGYSAQFAAQLARTLAARGDRVIHATPGSQLAAVDAEHYQLNLQSADQLAALFSQIAAVHGPIEGVVHLYGLGASAGESGALLPMDRQVDRCVSAAAVVRACEAGHGKTTCWLITTRAAWGWLKERHSREVSITESMDAALWGFGRSLMNEVAGPSVRLVDLEDPAALDTSSYTLARELTHPDAEQEVVLTGSGDRYVPRLRIEPSPAVQAVSTPDAEPPVLRLGFQFPGQLRNLRWEAHPRPELGSDEVEIEVKATGLNFRDVMYSLGLLSDEAVETGFAGPTLGLEFSGVVVRTGSGVRGLARGDRVVGFGPSSFSNYVTARAASVSQIPDKISFEAAATIPSVFFTVFYALHHLARLQEGERVLIHGAAGGVGIAAIQIAKWCGAEIFATAGSDEKRDFLRLLGADHVLDSRSLAFADDILAITRGEGVDVVLNSLAGEAINRNLRVLKPFGRFLELGKRDFYENTRIGLRPFRNNISYFGIDADQLMRERPDFTEKLFREMMALFRSGVLHPLPYHRFEAEEVVEAFRFMQQSRHIGKIVITYANGIYPVHTPRPGKRLLELPADASYLVTGGLGGFGLKTAQWLASKGARNLVLVSRSGPVSEEARAALAELEAAGVRVHAAACDITDHKALAGVLAEVAATLPPLRGIVHAAAVIDDGLARNMSREQIRRVFAPKILGAYNLHQLTLGKELDFFVLFSSATTLFGNPGQSNYVAANSCLEAFAAARRAAGLPALCVRWGPIDDVGFLARNQKVKEALQGRMGGAALHSAVALEVLEDLLLSDRSGLGVLELDWKTLSRVLPTAGSPRFSELAVYAADGQAEEVGEQDLRRKLAELPAAERVALLVDMLKKEVGEILRLTPDRIDENRSLFDMGLDSLMGVELATAVESRFGVRLPVMALSENPTIARLSERVVATLMGGAEAEEETPAAEVEDQMRQLLAQHAHELDEDTMKRFAEEFKQPADADKTARIIQ